MRPRPRLAALLTATSAWLWAASIYTPWAADAAPRLWLYDLLFYARAVLLAWAAAELALLLFRRSHRHAGAIALLGLVLAAWAGAALYVDSTIGWRWRTHASGDALDALARAGHSDRRQRAGHVLVDTVRAPCGVDAPWLWLGRPHGGGSGINLALVRNGNGVPDAPVAGAFVFLPLDGHWWLAYEHAARHHAGVPGAGACTPGAAIATHQAGLAHIAAGR